MTQTTGLDMNIKREITQRAVEIFKEADPLARKYEYTWETASIEEQNRLLYLLKELHAELNIPVGEVSPLFVDENLNFNKLAMAQSIRFQLLKESTHALH